MKGEELGVGKSPNAYLLGPLRLEGKREMEFQTILFEIRNQIAFVTFNRPESMNAVTGRWARDLVEACKTDRRDSAIRIVGLHRRGRRKSHFPPAWISKSGGGLRFSPHRAAPAGKLSANDHTQDARRGGDHKTKTIAQYGVLRRRGLELL